jgi:hypothetical protein
LKLNKLMLTAGAVGALGIAGSFGTFAAFTDVNPATTVPVTSGTIKVANNFQLPDLTNLGTRDTTWNCNSDNGTTSPTGGSSECFGGDNGKRAGSIRVENTGTLPQDVYLDFDGVGNWGVSSPNVESGDVLADNIIIDSSFDSNFGTLLNAGTRLWVVNREGPAKVATLDVGQSKTIYFRAHLRERFPGTYPGGDNEMQGKTLSKPEKVTVSAVEVGRDDLLAPVIDSTTDEGFYPSTSPRTDIGHRYDYGR